MTRKLAQLFLSRLTWCALFLVGVGVWFFSDFATRKLFFNHPEFTHYYPTFREWFLQRLVTGSFPTWNPFWGLGQTADITGTIPIDIYTPLQWLVGPKFYLFQMLQVVLLLLAGLYSFSRLGAPALVATLASLLFFFSPWVLHWVFFFIHINVFIGLLIAAPHILLWFETGERRHLVWVGGAIGFSLFGTRPDSWLFLLSYCTLFAVVSACLKNQFSRLAALLGVLLLGVAMHAWQLVPLLQIVAESGRVVVPGIRALWEREIYTKLAASVAQSGFLKVTAVCALLWVAAFARGWRRKDALVAALVVILGFRLWQQPELLNFLRSYGVGAAIGALAWRLSLRASLAEIARASCLLLPVSFYWCRVGVGDLHELQVMRLAPVPLQMIFGFIGFVGCASVEKHRRAPVFYLLVILVLLIRDQGQIVMSYLLGLTWIPTRDNFLIDFSQVALAGFGLTTLWRYRPIVPGILFVCLVVCFASNKYYSQWEVGPAPNNFGNYRGLRGADEVITSLRDSPEWRSYFTSPGGWEANSLRLGAGEVTLYSSLISARYRDWIIFRRFGIRPEEAWASHPGEYTPETLAKLPAKNLKGFRNDEVYWWKLRAWPPENSAVLRLMGVSHVVSETPLAKSADYTDYRQVNRFHTARLTDPLPRAFVVADLPSDKRASFSKEMGAFVEKGAVIAAGLRLPITPAKILRFEPERVEISVESPQGGIFVLTDLFHPFWSATVDGEPVDLFPALYVFRGLMLSKGRHRVEFTCRIPYFALGCATSCLAFMLWIWLAVADTVFLRMSARLRSFSLRPRRAFETLRE